MADEYTPTTDWVKTGWLMARHHVAEVPSGIASDEFDRWLAQHEAAIRRDQILKDAQLGRDWLTEQNRAGMRAYPDELESALRAQIGDTNE